MPGRPDVGALLRARDVAGLIAALSYTEYVEDSFAHVEQYGYDYHMEKAITDHGDAVRDRAREALVRIGAAAVEALIAALTDDGNTVSNSAAEVLVGIGRPAVEPLIGALTDHDGTPRDAVETLLRRIGEPAIGPLTAALKVKDGSARGAAAHALAGISEARVVEALIVTLKDQDSKVRTEGVHALAGISDARVVEALIAALKDEDSKVRSAAAYELTCAADERAVEPLIAALRDKDRHVRATAAMVLRKLTDPRAIGPLAAALTDRANDVRLEAALALAELGDARGTELLAAALSDKNADVRLDAALALGELGDIRAIEVLAAAMRSAVDNDRFGYTREKIVTALGKIGAPAVSALAVAVRWGMPLAVRKRAVQVLGQIGDAGAVTQLGIAVGGGCYSRDLDDARIRDEAAAVLARIGAVAVVPLVAALDSQDDQTRAGAAEALGVIGDLRAVEPLIATLSDQRVVVRDQAADALGAIGDARAVAPLIAELRRGEAERNGQGRRTDDHSGSTHARDALALIGTPAVEPLIATLKDKDWKARWAAASTLGRIGDTRAVEPLHAAAAGTTWIRPHRAGPVEARQAAAEALERIKHREQSSYPPGTP
jgi:HEAT repeat protein